MNEHVRLDCMTVVIHVFLGWAVCCMSCTMRVGMCVGEMKED